MTLDCNVPPNVSEKNNFNYWRLTTSSSASDKHQHHVSMIQDHSKQIILLLPYCQVKSCLTLCNGVCIIHLTASHHVSFLSSHIIRWEQHNNFEKLHSHSFYYSILLQLFYFIIVNLLLCLIYKLNFIIGVHVWKNSIYRVWWYRWFQASMGGLGKYPLQTRGSYCSSTEVDHKVQIAADEV